MQAYMSQAESGANWWRQGQGSIPQWDLQAQAEREARRILAESEPFVRDRDVFNVGRISATEHSNIGPLAMCHNPYKDLAADLAAILPELDRLANWPVMEIITTTTKPEDKRLAGLWERNRAELARLESR